MKRGSISVFLSLLLSASLVFVLVVAEASRYAGLRRSLFRLLDPYRYHTGYDRAELYAGLEEKSPAAKD